MCAGGVIAGHDYRFPFQHHVADAVHAYDEKHKGPPPRNPIDPQQFLDLRYGIGGAFAHWRPCTFADHFEPRCCSSVEPAGLDREG